MECHMLLALNPPVDFRGFIFAFSYFSPVFSLSLVAIQMTHMTNRCNCLAAEKLNWLHARCCHQPKLN